MLIVKEKKQEHNRRCYIPDSKEDFQYYQAVKENKGFCLVQDLFTMKESDDECDCGEFNHE
mgnify:FL=1